MVDEIGALALEREVQIVRSAVDMVAEHHARRVTVAGLRFGRTLLPVAARMAQDAGVRAVPLWGADDSDSDILVEGNLDG